VNAFLDVMASFFHVAIVRLCVRLNRVSEYVRIHVRDFSRSSVVAAAHAWKGSQPGQAAEDMAQAQFPTTQHNWTSRLKHNDMAHGFAAIFIYATNSRRS
jgi:hypothetical protein